MRNDAPRCARISATSSRHSSRIAVVCSVSARTISFVTCLCDEFAPPPRERRPNSLAAAATASTVAAAATATATVGATAATATAAAGATEVT